LRWRNKKDGPSDGVVAEDERAQSFVQRERSQIVFVANAIVTQIQPEAGMRLSKRLQPELKAPSILARFESNQCLQPFDGLDVVVRSQNNTELRVCLKTGHVFYLVVADIQVLEMNQLFKPSHLQQSIARYHQLQQTCGKTAQRHYKQQTERTFVRIQAEKNAGNTGCCTERVVGQIQRLQGSKPLQSSQYIDFVLRQVQVIDIDRISSCASRMLKLLTKCPRQSKLGFDTKANK
jgi:hypothetical protein